MGDGHAINGSEIREIGEALFGSTWQNEMAKAIGVPRQSISYYLRSGGAKGAQATAIIGLLARTAAREQFEANQRQATTEVRQADLLLLLRRFDFG